MEYNEKLMIDFDEAGKTIDNLSNMFNRQILEPLFKIFYGENYSNNKEAVKKIKDTMQKVKKNINDVILQDSFVPLNRRFHETKHLIYTNKTVKRYSLSGKGSDNIDNVLKNLTDNFSRSLGLKIMSAENYYYYEIHKMESKSLKSKVLQSRKYESFFGLPIEVKSKKPNID